MHFLGIIHQSTTDKNARNLNGDFFTCSNEPYIFLSEISGETHLKLYLRLEN